MKKILWAIALCMVLCWPLSAFCADVPMEWNPVPNAISYQVQISADQGQTWTTQNVGNVTEFIWVNAPDDKLILWRVGAMFEAIRYEAGAWYNGTLKRQQSTSYDPNGLGVK